MDAFALRTSNTMSPETVPLGARRPSALNSLLEPDIALDMFAPLESLEA